VGEAKLTVPDSLMGFIKAGYQEFTNKAKLEMIKDFEIK